MKINLIILISLISVLTVDAQTITDAAFPKGSKALMKYLDQHLEYPMLAKENELEGKVYVRFMIDEEGNIINPKVVKDAVGGGCSLEAERVVENMPNWIPAMKDGVPIKSYYTLLIIFQLNNPEPTLIDDEDSIFQNITYFNKLDKLYSEFDMYFSVSEEGKTIEASIAGAEMFDEKTTKQIIEEAMKLQWIPAKENGENIASETEIYFEISNRIVTLDGKNIKVIDCYSKIQEYIYEDNISSVKKLQEILKNNDNINLDIKTIETIKNLEP
ncbi:MAG: energy transducer TonB [Chitinophagales bacterium]|nr:energy transducer TonB [Chitinophagales bacterium]